MYLLCVYKAVFFSKQSKLNEESPTFALHKDENEQLKMSLKSFLKSVQRDTENKMRQQEN